MLQDWGNKFVVINLTSKLGNMANLTWWEILLFFLGFIGEDDDE
jgi:hypothetical protein